MNINAIFNWSSLRAFIARLFKIKHTTPIEPVEANDDAFIYSRFPDLNAESTIKKIAELKERVMGIESDKIESSQKELTATQKETEVAPIETLITALAEDASSIEIEKMVLPLIANLTETQAEKTLDALMREFYLNTLRADLLAEKIQSKEVISNLINAEETLTVAAFGYADKTTLRNKRKIKSIRVRR